MDQIASDGSELVPYTDVKNNLTFPIIKNSRLDNMHLYRPDYGGVSDGWCEMIGIPQ
jgi:hypothetical protein